MIDCQVLIVSTGGHTLALRCEEVRAVARVGSEQPREPRPTSLAHALGVEGGGDTDDFELLVSSRLGESAVTVDRIGDVITMCQQDFLPLPAMAAGAARSKGIEEAVLVDGRVVLVVQLASLLTQGVPGMGARKEDI